MEVIDHYLTFLGNRVISLLQLNLLENFKEKWNAACSLVQPSLPSVLERSGSIKFPPSLYNGECAIILCNHLSDLDWALLLAFMNPDFVKNTKRCRKPTTTVVGQTQQTQQTHPAKSSLQSKRGEEKKHDKAGLADELRPTAFTHSYFSELYVIGSLVKTHLMTLKPGIDETEMIHQIRLRQKEGCNVFILFPEGGILDKTKYAASHQFWKKRIQPNDPYEYKEVIYPRFRAYQSLVKTLGSKLKYVVDVTLMYSAYNARDHSWDYHKYPSLIYAAQHACPPVKMNVKTYNVKGRWQEIYEPSWLIQLWKLKDELLQSWRTNQQQQQQMKANST